MQEKHLYEYAVIRLVPCVEREEFMNVGVIVYCSTQHFLQMRYRIDETRLRTFAGMLNMVDVEERLQAFQKICAGSAQGGAIGKLPLASRFRWLASLPKAPSYNHLPSIRASAGTREKRWSCCLESWSD